MEFANLYSDLYVSAIFFPIISFSTPGSSAHIVRKTGTAKIESDKKKNCSNKI